MPDVVRKCHEMRKEGAKKSSGKKQIPSHGNGESNVQEEFLVGSAHQIWIGSLRQSHVRPSCNSRTLGQWLATCKQTRPVNRAAKINFQGSGFQQG